MEAAAALAERLMSQYADRLPSSRSATRYSWSCGMAASGSVTRSRRPGSGGRATARRRRDHARSRRRGSRPVAAASSGSDEAPRAGRPTCGHDARRRGPAALVAAARLVGSAHRVRCGHTGGVQLGRRPEHVDRAPRRRPARRERSRRSSRASWPPCGGPCPGAVRRRPAVRRPGGDGDRGGEPRARAVTKARRPSRPRRRSSPWRPRSPISAREPAP